MRAETGGLFARMLTLAGLSGSCTPTRPLSFHSNITKLAIGSLSLDWLVLRNLVRMKGSTGPPHELRLYMPGLC